MRIASTPAFLVVASVLAFGILQPRPPRAAEPADSSRPGLDHRVPWTTSRVVGSPEPPPPYRGERIYPRLRVVQPLAFEAEPGTRDHLIIQHLGGWAPPGRILRLRDDPEAEDAEVILELEGIAYGLDFHPDYARNGHLFVGQNRNVGKEARTRVSRFTVDRETGTIDPASEFVVIEWNSNGHNGGDVAFGNDGMLYVSSGDGSSDSDRDLRGQDLSHLTAKILRIDVDRPDAGRGYSVPRDNPFVGREGVAPETWAYGLRNPWRLSYDRRTGQLWAGVNGQDLWEFAILIEKGKNYGWSLFEGSHPFQPGRAAGPTPPVPPTVEHHHSEARSLSGGVVYHGDRLPELKGAYVYGDWSTGKVWAVRHDGSKVAWHREIADTPFQITGFGLGHDGELVVIDHGSGFYRLVPEASTADRPPFPDRLSQTGLFASTRDRSPAPGLIPYSVIAPLWSDGTGKERFIAVPGEGKVGFQGGGKGWDFPEGTVLVKTFLADLAGGDPAPARPIETRLMTRQQGEWVGYSYLWDDAGEDAKLVGKGGLDRTLIVRDPAAPGGRRTQSYRYPSRAECMVCHSRAANFVLGLSDLQMNRDHDYGGVVANQLRTLEHIGLFAERLPKRPEEIDRLVDPHDRQADLTRRARSYLHANCANCHVEAGGGNAAVDLTLGASSEGMRVIDVAPMQESFGIPDPRIIAPGHPGRSTLLERVRRRAPGQMPPLASSVVDEAAVRLLTEWIERMPPAVPK
ncbi:PQQ-dependent sugar dehydrogenase [Tundrisphaera sp. TA3]|uniref:PQQ-dependent sugar dehydrogenase n=1 Tax=Tundrisphaera sp. TA3 TaxID=3435775 RepID=UPI003EB716FE